jgi:hypothetical protein
MIDLDKKAILKQQLITSILLSLFFTFNLFIFGPLELYLTNINDLWFSVSDLLPCITIVGVIVFLVVFCICYFPKKAFRVIQCIVFGLAVGFYVQGNLVQVSYGVLDGREIDWNSYASWGIVNTLIWIACLGFPLLLKFKKEMLTKVLKYGSAFIVSIQISTLLVLYLTTYVPLEKDAFYLSNEDRFLLSKNKNIAVFILDTFDEKLFQEIMREDAEFINSLQGFTYFKNTVGAYSTTMGAMPFLLTGQYNKNEKPFKDYINESYRKTSFYKKLKHQSFDIKIYTSNLFMSKEQSDLISNIVLDRQWVSSHTDLAKKMYKFTFFRYMPHYLKKYFWIYTGEFYNLIKNNSNNGDNFEFYDSLLEQGISLTNQNCFRLYHLVGAHPPYNMNENVENVGDGNATALDQAKGSLNIVYEYINQLKKLDIYDNTTLIIAADHGIPKTEPTNPIMLIKPQNAMTGFQISNAPVSQNDFQATVISEITADYKQFGTSMFDISENVNRERTFYFYDWDAPYDQDYIQDLTEYKVIGAADDLFSYKPTGKVYSSKGVIDNVINLGEEITFIKNGKTGQLFRGMFWGSEGNFSWAKGKANKFFLIFNKNPENDVIATFNFGAFNPPQRMIVKCNEDTLLNEIMTDPNSNRVVFNIPKELINGNQVTLTLEYPDAVSPASIGESNDERILAFAFTSMKFEEDKQ